MQNFTFLHYETIKLGGKGSREKVNGISITTEAESCYE